jgi:hypothetical protein
MVWKTTAVDYFHIFNTDFVQGDCEKYKTSVEVPSLLDNILSLYFSNTKQECQLQHRKPVAQAGNEEIYKNCTHKAVRYNGRQGGM